MKRTFADLFCDSDDDSVVNEKEEEKERPVKEKITLDAKDLQEIIKIGTERQTRNETAGARERKSVNRNGLVLGIQGLIGEWLLYSKFNLDKAPLYDTTPRSFSRDVTRDAILQGKKIEVKTTYSHNFGIRVEMREAKNPADYYCFVTAVRNEKDKPFCEDEKIECIFHGFVKAQDLLCQKNLRTWSDNKQYYCLDNTAFRPWDSVVSGTITQNETSSLI